MKNINTMTPNELVEWFLMASYAYYDQENPIMSDYEFDSIALRLREQIHHSDHPHKDLITEDHLATMSGFDIEIPEDIKEKVDQMKR